MRASERTKKDKEMSQQAEETKKCSERSDNQLKLEPSICRAPLEQVGDVIYIEAFKRTNAFATEFDLPKGKMMQDVTQHEIYIFLNRMPPKTAWSVQCAFCLVKH